MRIFSRNRPYYVDAPPYRRTSGGIRVMHLLCHTLNRIGEEAYVYTRETDPALHTPTLTSDIEAGHRAANLDPITIYPEIVQGNPRGSGSVVRYVLNRAGLIGGTSRFDASELVYAFGQNICPAGTPLESVLFLPPFDLSVFHNESNPDDSHRHGALVYIGRHVMEEEERLRLPADAREISSTWPSSHEALAAELRRTQVLYCFESSAIAAEAVLCGCPVVLLRSPQFDGTVISAQEIGTWGIATNDSPAALEKARHELPKLRESVIAAEARYWKDLGRFVTRTQTMPVSNQGNAGMLTSRQRDYSLWRSRRTPQEIDGQLHAERMVSKWRFRPRFALGVRFGASDGELLANTIDALARQWYPEWSLVVFAAGIDGPPELQGIEQIRWLADADQQLSFATLRGAHDADFYAVLPVGTMLDDHGLQAISDEINASPQWLALYTDHDETDAEHAGAEPHFKPDFNPELLYSRNYVGPAAFVCREALDAFGDGDEILSASPYGLLLRIHGQTGPASIGHVADPLIHCPQTTADDDADAAALRRHFDRFGKRATIEDGWFSHTRRVRFERPAAARVSAIVMTHSQPGYLKNCLDALMRTAGQPPCELIVVAHAVRDPDLKAYLAGIETGALGIPCTLIHEAGPFRPAEFRNRAAAAASGDYLLFIDDDTESFHDGWLDALVGHAAACGLAAVGPRLISSTDGPPRIVGGGRILGLNGVAGEIGTGTPSLLDGGYDLRLQVDQAVSALPANCLLVRSSDFERLGGFDAAAAPQLMHDIDFCLRCTATGGRVAWLGSVDVAHQEGVTRAEATRSASGQADWLANLEHERLALLQRHLPRIANDPHYNRNYSLCESHHIDLQAIADWHPRFHDRPRLLGAPLTTGAGQYRMVAPFRALARAGLAQCTIVHPVADNRLRTLSAVEIARLAPDVVIYQNCIEVPMIRQLAESSRLNPDIEHIATIDDRLGDLPRDNPHYAIHARHARTRLREALAHCRRLIVTTEPLREYLADLIEDVRVVPNCLERDVWGDLTGEINDHRRPRVGWVGAMQHAGDLRLIEPIMAALADEVDFVLMGMCPTFLKPYAKEVHPFVSIGEYPRRMATLRLDLALAPLEQHPFNECKSNLRLIEYGALGWPVICTDIAPYRDGAPPVTRLANDPTLWIDTIRQRIHDRDHLKEEGILLRRWDHENYILEDKLALWMAALQGK